MCLFSYYIRSLGVLLYTLVYGAMPFDGSNFKRLVKQITTGDYYEPKQPARKIINFKTNIDVAVFRNFFGLIYYISILCGKALILFTEASSLIRTMLTVGNDTRANIADICSHWWVNEGYGNKSCLEEAEYLAGLTPVRLDLLLSLAPPGSAVDDALKETVLVEPTEEDTEQVNIFGVLANINSV